MNSFEHQADSQTKIEQPEYLRSFFNNGGMAELAVPLDYLLSNGRHDDENKLIINDGEDDGEFSAYWHDKGAYRLLVIRSNLARLAGLSLTLGVKHGTYELTDGLQIGATHDPRLGDRHEIGHYLLRDAAIPIGKPSVPIKVQKIVKWELQEACEDLKLSETVTAYPSIDS